MDEGSFKKRDFKRATWCAELTYICAQCTICSYHGNSPKHTGRQQAAPLQCRMGNLPPAGKALKAADALWHKLKPQANCYWVEPLWRFSRLQSRKHTPVSLLPTYPATYKNKFLCPHIKNCEELTPAQRKVFKKSTFHWKTQMGECFKTKQRDLLLTQHLLSEQNWTALELRNMWDSSSPGLREKSLHPVCPLQKAMLAGVSASGWKTCCKRSNNSHKEKIIPLHLFKGREDGKTNSLQKKLHRIMWVQLKAKSFSGIKTAKIAIKSKRRKRKWEGKEHDTYPQSIQLIVPRPFTSWATLDSNLSELSAAAAGRQN